MGDLSIAAAGALILRTFPFLLLRIVVYLGVAVAFSVAVGGGFGIGLGLGAVTGAAGRAPGAFWGAMAGLVFVSVLLWWLREYFLYFVEISHATAMALALDRSLPSAPGQIAATITALQRSFRETGALVSAKRLARRTVGDLAAETKPLADFLPPNRKLPDNVVDEALRISLGFVIHATLVRTIRGSARNVYSDLQASLVLLALHSRILLRNALLIAVASLAATLVLFFVSLIPASVITRSLPGGSILIAVFLAAAFAWSLRQALVEPFAAAAFLELYWRVVTKDAPDSGWDSRLTAISEAYREIKAVAAPPVRGSRRGVVA